MSVMYGYRKKEQAYPEDSGFQERDPQQHLRGNVFPAARQARGLTGAIWWGDNGSTERPLSALDSRTPDIGRDTVADGGPRVQWDPAYGMDDARDSFRYRFLNSLNLGKLIRPYRATIGNGRSDMMPAAEAVNRLTMGYPATPPVSNQPGGRMVAPGRVTRWPMTSLIWQPMGQRQPSS
jgi:hypothetical protein